MSMFGNPPREWRGVVVGVPTLKFPLEQFPGQASWPALRNGARHIPNGIHPSMDSKTNSQGDDAVDLSLTARDSDTADPKTQAGSSSVHARGSSQRVRFAPSPHGSYPERTRTPTQKPACRANGHLQSTHKESCCATQHASCTKLGETNRASHSNERKGHQALTRSSQTLLKKGRGRFRGEQPHDTFLIPPEHDAQCMVSTRGWCKVLIWLACLVALVMITVRFYCQSAFRPEVERFVFDKPVFSSAVAMIAFVTFYQCALCFHHALEHTVGRQSF